jgi:uncharacterized sporulation protein YeaH/YhbH (DUF444 family)
VTHIVQDLSKVDTGRSLLSEARLEKRLKGKINAALAQVLSKRGVTDLANSGSVTIRVDLSEPSFQYDLSTGYPQFVIPGNPRYNVNDTIPKAGGSGGGGGGAGGGDGEDDFAFEFPAEAIERYLFDELKLPDMEQKQFSRVSEEVLERAGYRSEGPPATLDLERSARRAVGRRKALGRPSRRDLDRVQSDIVALMEEERTDSNIAAISQLETRLASMKRRRMVVPYFDKGDLRYRHSRFVELPVSQAVVFCLLDTSGSMQEHHKKLAKYFFWLFRQFIRYQYQTVDLVWIRHTDTAQEITEEQFFFDQKNGGTVVSSALEKMIEIRDQRYPAHLWNYYACQASDGDCLNSNDALVSAVLLTEAILPTFQYFAYIECMDEGTIKGKRTSVLWKAYEEVSSPRFRKRQVSQASEIYPVFADLFRSKDTAGKRKIAA